MGGAEEDSFTPGRYRRQSLYLLSLVHKPLLTMGQNNYVAGGFTEAALTHSVPYDSSARGRKVKFDTVAAASRWGKCYKDR